MRALSFRQAVANQGACELTAAARTCQCPQAHRSCVMFHRFFTPLLDLVILQKSDHRDTSSMHVSHVRRTGPVTFWHFFGILFFVLCRFQYCATTNRYTFSVLIYLYSPPKSKKNTFFESSVHWVRIETQNKPLDGSSRLRPSFCNATQSTNECVREYPVLASANHSIDKYFY